MWSSLTTALEAGAEYSKKAVAEASVAASHAAAVAQQAAEQGAAVAQQAAASAAEEASKATGIAAATLSSMHTPEGSALLHQTVREFLALTGEGAADSATPAELVPLMRQRALTLIKAAESYREQANAMAERGISLIFRVHNNSPRVVSHSAHCNGAARSPRAPIGAPLAPPLAAHGVRLAGLPPAQG